MNKMRIIVGKWGRCVAATGLLLSSASGHAVELNSKTNLTVKPLKCIALHKGQTCYQTLTFSWAAPKPGHYCLYQMPSHEPITCWESNKVSGYKVKYESNKSEHYQLREQGSTVVVAEVSVRLATVYKQSKKSQSGWRLF